MPILSCSVDNCVHNQNCMCELEEIAVKGRKAEKQESTCCSTFCDCSGSLSNETVDPPISENSHIRCSANNCDYNKNCECHADSVDVNGKGANYASSTECGTFACGCH